LKSRLYYNDLLEAIEEKLGDVIEEVIDKYYSDKIDVELEFEDILSFIASELGSEEELEYSDGVIKEIKKLSRTRYVAELVVSYLLSKYIEQRSSRINDYDDSVQEFDF